MTKLQSEKLERFSDFGSLLKISLGLIVITMLSSTLAYAEIVSVDVEGNSFDVDYTATGMTVSGVEADLDFVSLIFTVDVTDSLGTLDITFDRSFYDSIYQGEDEEFIVISDGGLEPNFTETETTPQSRTLSIELPSGTEELEIIGSSFDNFISEPTTPEPVVETPEPVVETPEPVVETPEPVVETPKTQCGPGTILKDGVCTLDERCGPGTILKDGECVLDSTPKPTETSVKGMGKEMVMGVIIAFVAAGIVAVVFGIMSKASKSSS